MNLFHLKILFFYYIHNSQLNIKHMRCFNFSYTLSLLIEIFQKKKERKRTTVLNIPSNKVIIVFNSTSFRRFLICLKYINSKKFMSLIKLKITFLI